MNIRLHLAIAISLVSFTVRGQPAQSPSTQPQFEAASIRLAPPYTEQEIQSGAGNKVPWSTWPANRFTAHRVTLKLLIQLFYNVDPKYILGDAGWVDSQHYDVEAKVDGDAMLTFEEMKPPLQRLLEDRLHLVTHRYTKQDSGYALVVAKGGAKLKPGSDKPSTNGYILSNAIRSPSIGMGSLASMLSRPAGCPIVDKTGIAGNYDIRLSYAPANDPSSNLPSLFTAVEEQLGLRLVPAKVPVDYLVVDHAEKIPTEN